MKFKWLAFSLIIIGPSCATYYQINYKFNRHFEQGHFEQADRVLGGNQKAAEGKSRLLYYLNRGAINSILGRYDTSNFFLEKAFTIGENLRTNYLNEAVALLTNPMFTTYRGENHELLLLHYYKAINFLKMGQPQSALVECRRMNIKLNKISDSYRNNVFGAEEKFKRDAFIHTLMGIIYEADKDYNNAFIAYRNAVEIYEEDYKSLFGITVPRQLKKDLLRCAYLTSFMDEVRRYEEKFDMTYIHDSNKKGDIVLFWNNGLGPVKDEWSINFAIVKGAGGIVHFRNQELGLNFPFQLESEDDYEKKGLNDLSLIRVAFPKYVERPVKYNEGIIKTGGETYNFNEAENVNAIAFRSLRQRMLKEFSTSLLRAAIKKATEYQLRKQNEDLGSAIGIINALTEKADTRNWQTLPHTIYYKRLRLKPGHHEVTLKFNNKKFSKDPLQHHLELNVQENSTQFHTFHSMDTSTPNYLFHHSGNY